MDPSDFEVLPAALGVGTARVFARRHILKYRHPAIGEPDDFLASLINAFGPPPPEDAKGHVLWHRATGTHFTAYVHDGWAAYGGGLRFEKRPDAKALTKAYAAEAARRSEVELPGPDPLLADLLGSAASFSEHAGEVERARMAAPRGFFELLTQFEELLSRFPPPDRRAVLVSGLDGAGPVTLVERGLERGEYFERAVGFEDAHRAITAALPSDPKRAARVLYDWWAQHARVAKPPEALRGLLLEPWRARFEAAMAGSEAVPGDYQSEARARHEDHEQAQRWMRFARVALLLPLELADAERLADAAKGVAKQSTEYKKLDKLRAGLRKGAGA
jgi:hypothetical protein